MFQRIMGMGFQIPPEAGEVISAFQFQDKIIIVCEREVLVYRYKDL